MSAASVTVVTYLALLSLLNVALTVFMLRVLARRHGPLVTDEQAPQGLVLLCLRGGDEFLDRSLRLLFNQNYPRYRVRIVLDSPQDDARVYVDRVLADLQPDNVEVLTVGERFSTCTYKMSGILWGSRDLPEGTEFVALMDGDTVPHADWLRQLATPLQRPHVLCSTGNRWYFPAPPRLSSLVRVCWGAGALTLMTLFRIPWGGSMAVRREVLEDERLRDRIRHAFSEDTTIAQFVQDCHGLVHFDPRLTIINTEQIGWRSFFNFEVRQLIAVRMQHRSWWLMTLHGLSGLPLVIYPLARIFGWSWGRVADIAFVAAFVTLGLQAILMGPAIRKILRDRQERLGRWGFLRLLLAIVSVPATQILHTLAIVRALLARRIIWRGVHYKIGGTPPLEVLSDDNPAPSFPTDYSQFPELSPPLASATPGGMMAEERPVAPTAPVN